MEKIVIRVVHPKPLPDAPLHDDFEDVLECALKDAKATVNSFK